MSPVDLPPSDELRRQLYEHVSREMARARRLFGCKPQLTADAFTLGMLQNLGRSGDPAFARSAALIIIEELVPASELLTTKFWRSPLGQALAWVVGYHQPTVPQATVAAIVDVSRQRIHELVNAGRLARINGQVPADAVRDLLHRRYEGKVSD